MNTVAVNESCIKGKGGGGGGGRPRPDPHDALPALLSKFLEYI